MESEVQDSLLFLLFWDEGGSLTAPGAQNPSGRSFAQKSGQSPGSASTRDAQGVVGIERGVLL